MYYRRKVLLALLSQFEGKLDKTSLQKLLFLVSRHQVRGSYHFVPYKYGCYSFQANADLNTLSKYNQIKKTEQSWELLDGADYFSGLSENDKAALRLIKSKYGNYSRNRLIKLTYKQYPYFAINSTIIDQYLTTAEIIKLEITRPNLKESVLFTIGYEGISLEEYLNKLIVNDIRVLCDVRRNPVSMKFGFSKSQLANACEGVGIEYVHIPEVGIDADRRQKLQNQADYNRLFRYYKNQILPKSKIEQTEILKLVKRKRRVALTCFEANTHHCHRYHLAESLSNLDGFNFFVKHI